MHETGISTCFKPCRLSARSTLPILVAWYNMGCTVSSCKPKRAVIRGSSTRLKTFKSKAAGLHHCTYLPSTAKTSTASGLLRLHHHGPRKPQSIPRHPGEAAGCCRRVPARRAACPGGDEPQEEATATHHRLQAELLLRETQLPTRKSSCS